MNDGNREYKMMMTGLILYGFAAVALFIFIRTYHAALLFRRIGWCVQAVAAGIGILGIVKVWRKHD